MAIKLEPREVAGYRVSVRRSSDKHIPLLGEVKSIVMFYEYLPVKQVAISTL